MALFPGFRLLYDVNESAGIDKWRVFIRAAAKRSFVVAEFSYLVR
jgi:hypothetical protein